VAASEIADGETVILDVSTTVLEVARNLKGRKNLIVITNAIHIFMELYNCPEIQVILTGGILERDEMCLVGPIAESTLRRFYADRAIIGAGGLSPEKGITGYGIAESEVRKVMIESAREIVVVADSSKLDRISFTATAPLEKIHTLITDRHAESGQIKALKDRGVEVVICGPNEHGESTGITVHKVGN
jgi:DeoR family fructose operon transcriptional repressor